MSIAGGIGASMQPLYLLEKMVLIPAYMAAK